MFKGGSVKRIYLPVWMIALAMFSIGIPANVLAQGNKYCKKAASADVAGWASWCGSVSFGANSVIVAGTKQVTFGVNAAKSVLCGDAYVSMDFAIPGETLVDGSLGQRQSAGIVSPYYGYSPPVPSPMGGAVVYIPPGSHSVTFKLPADIPNDCLQLSAGGQYLYGPFVVMGGNGANSNWSTPVPFRTSDTCANWITLSGKGINTTNGCNPGDPVPPGGTIHYSIDVSVECLTDKLKLMVALPQNTSLNPGSVTPEPYDQDASSLTVIEGGTNEMSVEFDVTVANVEQIIQSHAKQVTCKFTAYAWFDDGTVSSETSTATNDLAMCTITGQVDDVRMTGYPDKNSTVEFKPMAGVGVRLVDAGENTISFDTTASDGSFTLAPTQAGDYIVQVYAAANHYSPRPANYIETNAVMVYQRVPVKVSQEDLDSGKKINMADDDKKSPIRLPVDLTNYFASTLQALSNLSSISDLSGNTFSFWKAIVDMNPTPYLTLVLDDNASIAVDVSGVESFLDNLIANQNEVMHDEKNTTHDQWNSAVRLAAALGLLNSRYQEYVNLGKDFGSFAGALLVKEIIDRVADYLQLPKPTGLSELAAKRAITTINGAAGYLLPAGMNLLSLSSDQQNTAMTFFTTAVKVGIGYGMKFLSSDIAKNSVASIFTKMVSTILSWEVLSHNVGSWTTFYSMQPGVWQSYVDRAVGFAASKVYAGGAQQALQEAANLNTEASQRYIWVRNFGGQSASQVYSAMNLSDDLFKDCAKVWNEGQKVPMDAKDFSKWVGSVTGWITATKYSSALFALALPLGEMWVENEELDGMMGVCPNGNTGPIQQASASSSGGLEEAHSSRAKSADPEEAVAARTAGASAAQNYLAVLKKIAQALNNCDVIYFNSIRASLLNADSALFDGYLVPLYQRCQAALPNMNNMNAGQQFLWDFANASNGAEGLYKQLDAWASDPSDVPASDAMTTLNSLYTAVSTVLTSAAQTAAAINTVAVPGFIVITGQSVPQTISGTSPVNISFNFTNVGDAAIGPATATLSVDGALSVEGNTQCDLPLLAPGKSAECTWTVLPEGATDQSSTYDVLVGGANVRQSYLEGGILVGP
jgi:hypothetical protein